MKTYLLFLAAFLPLMAGSQTPGFLPRHTFSEVQKSSLQHEKFKFSAQQLFDYKTNKEEWVQMELPSVKRERIEQKFSEKHPQHKTIKYVRENLSFNPDAAVPDSVLTYSYSSPEDSVLIEKLLYEYNEALHYYSFYAYQFDTVSEIWHGAFREDFYPDAMGRDTLIITYTGTFTGKEWEPTARQEFAYDSSDNIVKSIYYTWDTNLQTWRGEYWNESAYDEMNRLIYNADYYWDYNKNDWIGTNRYELGFDSRGNQILNASYYWDYNENSWKGYTKYELEFNEKGYLTANAYYYWDEFNNSWRGEYKAEYFYKPNGYRYMFIYSTWDESLNQWQNSEKVELSETFTENFRPQLYQYYQWLNETSEWELYYEAHNEYSASERLATMISNIKDESSGEMVFYEKFLAVFDESGNPIKEERYLWSIKKNKWLLASGSSFIYDNDNRINESIYFYGKDSCILSPLINALDSTQQIHSIAGDFSCPENDCLSVDTIDYIQGKGALLWNYDARGLEYWGGFSQGEIDDVPDLTGKEGVSLHLKILVPSNARFNIIFLESGGEEWRYEHPWILADNSNEWKQLKVSFYELFIPEYGETINGIFDKNDIDKIQFQIYVYPDNYASGSLLIDNFSGYTLELTDSTEIHFRNVKKYDDKGHIVADSTFYWDYDKEKLLPVEYSIAEFNEAGRRIFYEAYWWDDYLNRWIGSNKNESEYNQNNFLTSSVNYFWNHEEMNWFIESKKVIEYNDIGLETLTEEYYYDWNLEELVAASRHELTYNSGNEKTSESYYYWDNYIGKWIGDSKTEWIYNQNNELVNELMYGWNYDNYNWQLWFNLPVEQQDIVYNETGDIYILTVIQWNEDFQQWMPARKSYYFYNPLVGFDSFALPESLYLFDFYPNPASEVLNLKLEGTSRAVVDFIDFNGKTVKATVINPGTTQITIGDMIPGQYLVQVKTPLDKLTKKLVIQ